MKILAIETSCDDTGIAILDVDSNGGFKVLSNVIASQVEIGKKYGGVYPMMAKREHQKNLPIVFKKALKNIKNIDLIAVTSGPGLEPCLWTGINFAKELSLKLKIPIVPVNHIEAHILVNLLENPDIKFPAIALVVSGGHTQLILVKKIGNYKILGETRDDAAGECFDKCAKILGLGYPGGPIISKLANQKTSKPENQQTRLPRPMIGTNDYDFSFSGLKTAVLYSWQKQNKKDLPAQAGMAAEIQQAIIDVLIKKTMKAIKDFSAKSLILGGGVSANHELRKQFKNKLKKESPATEFFVPKPDLSTDNALMTAITGFYHKTKKIGWQKLQADANLRISK
ncbi:MAG: tRNA (adenosine(37)-N6)-threonylcarbamoyltransferase complex transferase subunit TsaD [Candidatus Staskawiczbacteria bacterium]|jgi:N6-L-threonylcarbamoyladenine synthase